MKKTIKTIRLKDIRMTADLIYLLQEEHGDGFGREMARLTTEGILQRGGEEDIPKVSEEKLEQLIKEGKSIFDDELEQLEDSMRVDGYLPEEHSYLKVYRDNYLVDGGKRFFVLQRLFHDEYQIDVEELTI